jgi:hypothetical protein
MSVDASVNEIALPLCAICPHPFWMKHATKAILKEREMKWVVRSVKAPLMVDGVNPKTDFFDVILKFVYVNFV